jgi:hypothetical protein
MGGNLTGLHIVIAGEEGRARQAAGPFKTGVDAVEWAGTYLPEGLPFEVLPLHDATTVQLYFSAKKD